MPLLAVDDLVKHYPVGDGPVARLGIERGFMKAGRASLFEVAQADGG